MSVLYRAFREFLGAEDWEFRHTSVAAAAAMHQIDPGSELAAEAFGACSRALHDISWRIRYKAAEGLGTIGDPAAISDLEKIANDTDEYTSVREVARMALLQLQEDEAVVSNPSGPPPPHMV
mmetsp:Transcript_25237/g.50578  ORF Transcript_25237/g.50578 Transcript_25237/m.50578 type:complete len:122 (+) Transcript_25237:1-366(+)